MRMRFEQELSELNNQMMKIGMLCETAISKASKALFTGNFRIAQELPELLNSVTEKEREIEGICMKLLLKQQPVAKDLRTISSALKMVTDAQRIGTQSADIAEIYMLGNISAIPEAVPLSEMAAAVIKMVTDSIDSFVKQDGKIAAAVIEYDDVVDALFNDCKLTLIELLKQHGTDGEAMVDLLMISKYFERIGDHAVNIAKWVLFSITGNIEL